ncbi:MAG: hypothetical protein GX410_01250 [Elusimicrobia bacterium]|nr:hypothetical protein [Elusimicrobiota bacterium]
MAKHGLKLQLLALALVALGLFWLLQARRPYYFLQDDNRTLALPSAVHISRTLAETGSIQQYNFHQFLGYPVLASSAALYPPVYAAAFLSKTLLGHAYGTMDILVLLHLLAAALGAFLLFSYLGLRGPAPWFSGLAWGFCPFVVYVGASWWVVSLAAAFFPFLLLLTLRLLRRPDWLSALWLALAQVLFLVGGYPQYFVYALVLELPTALALEFMARRAMSGRAVAASSAWEFLLSNQGAFKYYLLAGGAALLLAAPYLLPLLDAVVQSADRSRAFSFADFSIYNLSAISWLKGIVYPAPSPLRSNLLSNFSLPELSYIGYVPLALAVLAFYRMCVRKRDGGPYGVYPVAFAAAIFCWLWAAGTFNFAEYLLPVLNRLRWHFKILLFVDFYLILAASAALFWLWTLKPRLAWALAALHVLNISALFWWGPAPVFSLHTETPPLSEPLSGRLREGRIFTAGFDPLELRSAQTLGFNYATLSRLSHFAGYDVLVPQANKLLTLNLGRDGGAVRPPADDTLSYLRKWGVRWYVLSYPVSGPFKRFAERARLSPVSRGEGRAVFEDKAALPMVWRMERNGTMRELESHISGNFWDIATQDAQAGCLRVNTLYNSSFLVRPAGAILGPSSNGQTEVCYPAGTGTLRLYYSSPSFRTGVRLFWVFVLFCAAAAFFAVRRSRGKI